MWNIISAIAQVLIVLIALADLLFRAFGRKKN